MCGIAGFNCTTEVAEGIDFDAFISGAQSMTQENYHRGGDAAGFMLAFNSRGEDGKENATYWWKSPTLGTKLGATIESMLTEDYSVGRLVPNVLGIHTRAKSSGFSETEADNNHPVVSGNVLTTHNGMVSNHIALKTKGEKLYEKDWKAGTVDSLAIPIMFRGITDPVEQYDEIGKILPEFEGGFAFHTMWTQKPGASLLVAGERYPLVVSVQDGMVSYASEAPCIRKCVPKFGMSLNGTTVRKMDPGTFLIVYNGEVVHKGTYDLESREYKKITKTTTGGFKSKEYQRWVPQAGKWFKRTAAKSGVTTGTSEDLRFYSSIDHTLPEDHKVELIYTRKDGIVNPEAVEFHLSAWKNSNVVNGKSKAPKLEKGDNILKLMDYRGVFEDVCEADAIWVTRDIEATGFSASFYVYAWYDKTEVVMNDTGQLIGIYNWADGEMNRPVYATQYDLYIGDQEKRDKEKAEQVKKLKSYKPYTLDTKTGVVKWIRKNSIAPNIPLTGEKIVGGDDSSTGKVERPSQWPHQNTTTTLNGSGNFDKKLTDKPTVYLANDPDIMTWMEELTEQNALNNITLHMNPSITIPMLWSELCTIHNQPMQSHTQPLECVNIIAAAAITVSFFKDIFTWQAVFDDEIVILYSKWGENSTGCRHDWRQTDFGVYPMWGYDILILEKEVCDKCGANKELSEYPTVIRKFLSHFADDYDDKRKEATHGGMYL